MRLDEKDVRIAMDWVARQFYVKARSEIPDGTVPSTTFAHGFGAKLKLPDGKTIYVEAQVRFSVLGFSTLRRVKIW